MKVLGAVLAGGRSRRFGSDKALALLEGRALIDHSIAALRPQVDGLVVCGREHSGVICLPDRPAPDLGPLGGLCAALRHGADAGFDAVLSVPCDTPALPDDLLDQLRAMGPAAYVPELPVIGLWPTRLADVLSDHLATSDDRAMRRFARIADAVAISLRQPLANINRPDDLARQPG
ncbi:molybdenum cofactor guanylyltransferase [Nostoc sp. 3335mG]|nr:molybdenum cofactor guanylyltransferase [Nostoc sp. 3335mG]